MDAFSLLENLLSSPMLPDIVGGTHKAKAGARKRDVYFTLPGQEGEDNAYYLVIAGFDR